MGALASVAGSAATATGAASFAASACSVKHQADVGDVVELEMLTPRDQAASQPHADLARQLAAELAAETEEEASGGGAGCEGTTLGGGWRCSSQSTNEGDKWADAFSSGLAA